jgi:hypothetical protein
MVQRNKQTNRVQPASLAANQEEIWSMDTAHCCTAPLTGWVILSSCFLLLLGYNVHQCTVQGHLAPLLLPVKRNCELWLSDVQKFEN